VPHCEHAHTTEVPSLAHLTKDLAHDGTITAHDHFLRLESCIRVAPHHAHQNAGRRGPPLSIGRLGRRRILERVSADDPCLPHRGRRVCDTWLV